MIENQNNKIVYAEISGATFNFPIRFFDNSDIQCFLESGGKETTLINGTDFRVSINSDGSDGGVVTLLLDPFPAGARLTIMRVLPIMQLLSLPEFGKLPSAALEVQLDRIVMICQQLQEMGDRSVKWSPGADPDAPPKELLIAALEAAKEIERIAPELRSLAAEVRALQSATKAEISRLTQQVIDEINAARTAMEDAIASLGILVADRTISLESITNTMTPDEAWPIADRNIALLAAQPHNLGGHTLTINLNTQYLKHASLSYIVYQLDGFYNGKIVFSGGICYSDPPARDLQICNCDANIRFEGVQFTSGVSGNTFAIADGFVWLQNCRSAVFSRCSFRGRISGPADPESSLYDPFGHCIAAIDTPVYVPIANSENRYLSFAYGAEMNDISDLLGVDSPDPYVDENGETVFPDPVPELLCGRWNTRTGAEYFTNQ